MLPLEKTILQVGNIEVPVWAGEDKIQWEEPITKKDSLEKLGQLADELGKDNSHVLVESLVFIGNGSPSSFFIHNPQYSQLPIQEKKIIWNAIRADPYPPYVKAFAAGFDSRLRVYVPDDAGFELLKYGIPASNRAILLQGISHDVLPKDLATHTVQTIGKCNSLFMPKSPGPHRPPLICNCTRDMLSLVNLELEPTYSPLWKAIYAAYPNTGFKLPAPDKPL